MNKGYVFVIAGPSGSGKTTLARKVLGLKGLKGRLKRSTSFTTRPKRSCEQEGKDYFFITPQQFKQLNKDKKIIEYTRYLGYYYGTPREFVENKLRRGNSLLLCLDLRGVKAMRKLFPINTVSIFVRPPSLGELEERIEKRSSNTSGQEIKKRLGLARKELKAAGGFDYRILNSDLVRATDALKKIILTHLAG